MGINPASWRDLFLVYYDHAGKSSLYIDIFEFYYAGSGIGLF